MPAEARIRHQADRRVTSQPFIAGVGRCCMRKPNEHTQDPGESLSTEQSTRGHERQFGILDCTTKFLFVRMRMTRS